MSSTPIGAAIAAGTMLAAIVGDALPDAPPSVWTVGIALVSAWTLFRAGSVRAWKETAEAREERIRDLAYDLSREKEVRTALEAELAIPERLEGLLELLGSQATRADEAADRRLEVLNTLLEARFSRLESLLETR